VIENYNLFINLALRKDNLRFLYKMLKYFSGLIILFYLNSSVQAQRATRLSRTEFGFMVGGMYYLGDLNPLKQFNNTQFSAGLMYRYNVHSRLCIRLNALYGNVSGNDFQSSSVLLKNRNLNFTSSIFELAGGIEFNYLPFAIGHDKYKGTAYILAEIGVFHMNPMTQYNGDVYELQKMSTEGQGTSLSSQPNYNLYQLCLPIGAGVKMTLGKRASLNVEFGLRKTFTDYLDDVHADTYVDPLKLQNESGPISTALSNRSLDGSKYGKRGTSSTNDWYVFTGMMLTFKLGKASSCFYH